MDAPEHDGRSLSGNPSKSDNTPHIFNFEESKDKSMQSNEMMRASNMEDSMDDGKEDDLQHKQDDSYARQKNISSSEVNDIMKLIQ